MKFEDELFTAWCETAERAFSFYLDKHPTIDAIDAERMKPHFIQGFICAGRPPPPDGPAVTRCDVMEPRDILILAGGIAPYIMAFGRHCQVSPGAMMTALAILLTRIGRQQHPSFSHQQIFAVFAREVAIVLQALDRTDSSAGERTH